MDDLPMGLVFVEKKQNTLLFWLFLPKSEPVVNQGRTPQRNYIQQQQACSPMTPRALDANQLDVFTRI